MRTYRVHIRQRDKAAGAVTRPLIDRTDSIRAANGRASVAGHFDTLFEALAAEVDAEVLDALSVDAFVTFEPWIAEGLDGRDEGTFVTGWRDGKLGSQRAVMRDALAQATQAWLTGSRPPGWPDGKACATFVVDIRLYDGLGAVGSEQAGQCILRLRRCEIPLSDVA
jgi:hypothetical protein